MEISVANRQRRIGISTEHVRLLTYRVLEDESARFDEISVSFLSSAAMRILNRRFTGRDEATDTLAFDIPPGRIKGRLVEGPRLAEVVVCAEKAREQAGRYGVGVEEELARLLIHGLLHLSGFDDRTPSQRVRMRRRENLHIKRLSKLLPLLLRGKGTVSRARRPRRRPARRSNRAAQESEG